MNVNRSVSLLLAIASIILAAVCFVYLQSLPRLILSAIDITDNNKLAEATLANQGALWLLSAQLIVFAGVVVVFYLWSVRPRPERIIYVPKYITEQEDTQQQEAQTTDQHSADMLTELETIRAQHAGGELTEGLNALLSRLAQQLEAGAAAAYRLKQASEGHRFIEFVGGYAFYVPEDSRLTYAVGEGIAGQVAKSEQAVFIDQVPEGYITVLSGLGRSSPGYLAVVPLRNDAGQLDGVLELAAFQPFGDGQRQYLQQASALLGQYMQRQHQAG